MGNGAVQSASSQTIAQRTVCRVASECHCDHGRGKYVLHVQQLFSAYRPKAVSRAAELGKLRHRLWRGSGSEIGREDKPVFALQGDGAYGISGLSEVMTAVREEIPVIAVVFNNNEWAAEKKNQIDYYDNRFLGTNLTNPDFAQIARDMGAEGYRIESAGDVRDVVEAAVRSGKPAVIDAIIDGSAEVLAEPFRRDALKKPVRLLEKYRHLTVE